MHHSITRHTGGDINQEKEKEKRQRGPSPARWWYSVRAILKATATAPPPPLRLTKTKRSSNKVAPDRPRGHHRHHRYHNSSPSLSLSAESLYTCHSPRPPWRCLCPPEIRSGCLAAASSPDTIGGGGGGGGASRRQGRNHENRNACHTAIDRHRSRIIRVHAQTAPARTRQTPQLLVTSTENKKRQLRTYVSYSSGEV